MRSPTDLLEQAPSEQVFTSRLRSPAVAARVGVWLGAAFTICFLTGLVSHWAQSHDPWFPFPTQPAWGYRVTQGLHVISGTAAVPLFLVKLWTVFPNLLIHPPTRLRELVLHGLERVSILVLVAAAVFQLASGLANSAQWYPWSFSFRSTHYAIAWVAIGALVVHIGVKLPLIRAAFAADLDSDALDRASVQRAPVLDGPGRPLGRRGLLRTTWAAAAVAVLATAGSTVPLLRRVSVLGVRSGDGPQDVPVNKSAVAAGVTELARDPAYRLVVSLDGVERAFSRDELSAMPQHTVSLPIACVEGWSAGATWTGVRLRDLLDASDVPRGRDIVVRSLQPSGPYRATIMQSQFVDDDRTLLALMLHGEPLSIDHGYPVRVIAPNRPGVLQTKWVGRLEVEA